MILSFKHEQSSLKKKKKKSTIVFQNLTETVFSENSNRHFYQA